MVAGVIVAEPGMKREAQSVTGKGLKVSGKSGGGIAIKLTRLISFGKGKKTKVGLKLHLEELFLSS